MLKMHFDIQFNFPKLRMLDYPELMPWITSMTQGARGTVSFLDDQVFPARPLKSNTHKSFNKEQHSAVYLINDDRMESIVGNGCIMYSGVGDEVNTLSTLIKDEDYGFEKEYEIKRLDNWGFLDNQVTPSTDVIVVDRYILSDEQLYENNIYTFVSKLCQRVRNSSVNIVIFTCPSYYSSANKHEITPDWGVIRSKIKSRVRSVTGQDPKVTFVLQRKMAEHDRTVFTNYQYYVSGDSLNYFDSKWNVISNGRYFRIVSMAHHDHYNSAMTLIKDLQHMVDVIKKKNPDAILFDKSCSYLSF